MWPNPQETAGLVTFTEENFIFCAVYDITNPRLSQGNPSSKRFWLKMFWVDKIPFPPYHKMSVKVNKS